jgi:2-desacetyl-2-hydroxyethyl bacteriochlorophyllide A dehydrogenase
MRAAIIDKPGRIRIGQVPDPTPAPHEVVVRVAACGVCGTDLHIADGEFPPTPYPIVPGHEFAGEVVAVGSSVTGILDDRGPALREGTSVAVDPSLFCGHCEFCRRGRGNLCLNWGAIGDTVGGAFAEYVAVPAVNAYVLPDEISFQDAALIEPLSCAVHGMHRLGMRSGDSALIIGAGTMGLLLLQLAVRGGASRVAVLDMRPQRLPLAERLGAAWTATEIEQLLDGEPLGFDCVIDATGAPKAIEAGLSAVRRGGKFLVFGVAPADARIAVSPFRVYNDEITMLGSMAVLNSVAPAVDLVRGGALNLGALRTHAFTLEEFPRALETVRHGEGVKVQVLPNS